MGPALWSTEFGEGGVFYEKVTQEAWDRCCCYLTRPLSSHLCRTQWPPQILPATASFLWLAHRARWKDGELTPRPLIKGKQWKISTLLTASSRTVLRPVLQQPKENLLTNAFSVRFPPISQSLPHSQTTFWDPPLSKLFPPLGLGLKSLSGGLVQGVPSLRRI